MYYLLLFVAVLGIAVTFSLGKAYQVRVPATFGVILRKSVPMALLSALMFYCMSGFCVTFSPFTVFISVLSAVLGTLSAVVCYTGYASGSIAVFTMFQMVGGMLLPFLYGIWYGNQLTVCRILGMILMLLSVALPFAGQRDERNKPQTGAGTDGEPSPSRKRVRFLLLCVAIFVINGSFSIISYIHSNSPRAADTYSYLVIKSLMTVGLDVLLYVGYRCLIPAGRNDRVTVVNQQNGRGLLGLLALFIVLMTAADGLSYWLQLVGAAHLPAVALYPIVTGGTTVATALSGRLFFGEHISKRTGLALLLTLAATILFMF